MFAIVAMIAAIVLAPVVLLLLARPVDAPGQSPRQSIASNPASASASGADADCAITDLGDGIWWRIGWRPLIDVGPADFARLRIGRMSGDVLRDVRLGVEVETSPGAGGPFVVGPEGGVLLYSTILGEMTQLHLLDACLDRDRVLSATGSVLYDADLAPSSGWAYFVTGDPAPGVWRVGIDGLSQPSLVAALPGQAANARLAVSLAPIDALPRQVTVRLDEHDARLAVPICERSCSLRIVDLATGASVVAAEDLDPADREISDFVDGVVVLTVGIGYDAVTGAPAPIPDGARRGRPSLAGWQIPNGWILSERPMASDGGVVGSTWFVATGPNGEEVPIEAMGLGIGQG